MRPIFALLASILLAACQTTVDGQPAVTAPARADTSAEAPTPELIAHYSARNDGGVSMRGIDPTKVDPAFHRQVVRIRQGEVPGTILVDTRARYLYLVQENDTAIRYGVSVGREGFQWAGTGVIGRKAVWPGWTPPPEMIARQPYLGKWAKGMPGGPQNPLGARALYIYNASGRDTAYRIHGTNEPASIGRSASSGCIRMFNQDVVDLFSRVPKGAVVKVF